MSAVPFGLEPVFRPIEGNVVVISRSTHFEPLNMVQHERISFDVADLGCIRGGAKFGSGVQNPGYKNLAVPQSVSNRFAIGVIRSRGPSMASREIVMHPQWPGRLA